MSLGIFDATGRRINSLEKSMKGPGDYEVKWNGVDQTGAEVSSGVYFYKLSAGKKTITKKMILMR